jgi:hypothetical protein
MIIGVFGVVCFIITLVVFRVFGSEEYIYVDDCTPYNISIENGREEKTVVISWQTRNRCIGYLLYGSQMRELNLVGVDLENEVESRDHIVVLKNLSEISKYYFSIISGEVTYGKEGLPVQFSISSL